MIWSIADLLLLAKLANASYDLDTQQSFTALGTTWIEQFGNDQCQCTVAQWGGYSLVVIRGTQVGSDPSLPELWDDIDPGTVTTAAGNLLCAGFWRPLAALWPVVAPAMPPGQPLVVGHSLGGVRAHMARFLCPSAEVVSFGAPRGADPDAWLEAYPVLAPTRVVNRADFAPAWEPFNGWNWDCTQPGPMQWIDFQNNFVVCESRPIGDDLSIPDHDIVKGYIAALAAML